MAEHPDDREEALREVVRAYSAHMHDNTPVHEWEPLSFG